MGEVKARSPLNFLFLLVGFLFLLVLLAPFDVVLLVSPVVFLSGQLVLVDIQLFYYKLLLLPNSLFYNLLLLFNFLLQPTTIQLFVMTFICSGGGFQDLVGGRNYRRLEEEVWQARCLTLSCYWKCFCQIARHNYIIFVVCKIHVVFAVGAESRRGTEESPGAGWILSRKEGCHHQTII